MSDYKWVVEINPEKGLTKALMKSIFYSVLAAALIVTGCKAAEQPSPASDAQQVRAELEKRHLGNDPDIFVQAAGQGDIKTIELFLRVGMNPNATNKYGST